MFKYTDKILEHFKNPRNYGKMKNPDGVGREGNPVCVVPETLVELNSHITEIKNLRKGQKILGHDGKYHKIKDVHSRPYKGKLLLLRINNLGQIAVTPDHLIFATKTHNYPYKYKAFRKGEIFPGWHHAYELEKGDLILYPIPKETKEIKSIKLDIKKPYWDFKSKELPGEIEIGYNFLRLIGYYLAEGWVNTRRCQGTISFVFGSHEKEYIDDVIFLMKKIFNLESKGLKIRNNSMALYFYSARLARFFEKNFGKGTLEKHLPDWIMKLPTKKQYHLLKGLWRGDGSLDENRQRAKYVTISQKLAYQLRNLLFRRRIINSLSVGRAYGNHKKSYLFYIQHDPSLKQIVQMVGKEFEIKERGYNPHKSWFDENYFYTTIKEVRPTDYRGTVYNLEVEGSRSYVSEAAALHNCGDVMEIYIKVQDNRISDIKFLTFGCIAAIGVSSILTEIVKGKTIEEAKKLTARDLLKEAGELPPVKYHCSVLGVQALRSAIADYESKKQRS